MSDEQDNVIEATPVLPALTPTDEAALRALQAKYWARADARDPNPAADLFCEDAIFVLAGTTMRGRAEIAEFFDRREAANVASGRVTRHLAAPPVLQLLPDGTVTVSSTVLAMAGSGALPIVAALPSIADFEDVCVRQPDGTWLFARRDATSIFLGPQAPGFARGTGPADDRNEHVK